MGEAADSDCDADRCLATYRCRRQDRDSHALAMALEVNELKRCVVGSVG